jgi:triacylglycerol lipase
MITDADLAVLAEDSYRASTRWRGRSPWNEDVHVCATDREGVTVVLFRGTTLRGLEGVEDVLRDLSAAPRYAELFPAIGFCHSGFLAGVEAVAQDMMADLRGARVILAGHSLGGAMALIFGAMLAVAGRTPTGIVTFGAPRAGFGKLRRTLRSVPVLRCYRNGQDPVPALPWWLPWWPYQQPRALIAVGVPGPMPIGDHHIASYRASLQGAPAGFVQAPIT